MQTSGTAGFKLMFTKPLLLTKNVINFIRVPIQPRSNVSVSAKLVLIDKLATFNNSMAAYYIAASKTLTALHKALFTSMQLGKFLTVLHKALFTFMQLSKVLPALHDAVSAFMKTPNEETQDMRDRQEDEEGEWPRQFRSD